MTLLGLMCSWVTMSRLTGMLMRVGDGMGACNQSSMAIKCSATKERQAHLCWHRSIVWLRASEFHCNFCQWAFSISEMSSISSPHQGEKWVYVCTLLAYHHMTAPKGRVSWVLFTQWNTTENILFNFGELINIDSLFYHTIQVLLRASQLPIRNNWGLFLFLFICCYF